jgi:uncharacterized repeat protein (TIGR04052 family)
MAGLWLTASGCAGDSGTVKQEAPPVEVTLRFEARVGDVPFACGQRLKELGTSQADAEPMDLRLYVHDVRLLRNGSEAAPLALTADDAWQSDSVALLDFEDASGRCSGGTQETNREIRGTAPSGDYTGVALRVGVPAAQNHLDLSLAAAPLNLPAMYWSWQGGYKYLKAELATATSSDGYLLHLGAQACGGSPATGVFNCQADNVAEITLMGDLLQPIALDVAQLFADVDLLSRPDMQTDIVPGCMSSPGDPECAPLLATLGLPAGEQKVFSLP